MSFSLASLCRAGHYRTFLRWCCSVRTLALFLLACLLTTGALAQPDTDSSGVSITFDAGISNRLAPDELAESKTSRDFAIRLARLKSGPYINFGFGFYPSSGPSNVQMARLGIGLHRTLGNLWGRVGLEIEELSLNPRAFPDDRRQDRSRPTSGWRNAVVGQVGFEINGFQASVEMRTRLSEVPVHALGVRVGYRLTVGD
jgi:hypothetical protein